MGSALIPAFPGRPAVVRKDDWVVYVSVHDAWHLKERQRRKARIIASHPDSGGTRQKFLTAMEHWRGFVAEETLWYQTHDLTPPSSLKLPVIASTDLDQRTLKAVREAPGSSFMRLRSRPDSPRGTVLRGSLVRLHRKKLIEIRLVYGKPGTTGKGHRQSLLHYWPASDDGVMAATG